MLELGIGLGHTRRYIDKMIMGEVYPCIGIGYWIGSYLTVHRQNDHAGGIPMYWNWVLDWVITDGTLNN